MNEFIGLIIFIIPLIILMITCILLYFENYDKMFKLNKKFIFNTLSIITMILITSWLIINAIIITL